MNRYSVICNFIAQNPTNWEEIMPLLKEIGYDGDFTYEVHGFYSKIPDDLRIEAGKLGYKIGMYLMDLYAKA